MKSALIHGVLLAVMLVYGYRTWTRDKTVKPDYGSVVLWNKTEADLVAIEFKTEKKTIRLDHKDNAYWWGTETTIEKKPKPVDPAKKPDPAGTGSASGSGSAAPAGSGSGSAAPKPAAGSGSGSAVAAGSGSGSAAGSGSGSAAPKPPPPPPVEMVETTKKREFPLGDGGDKIVKGYLEARALRELGSPTDAQKKDYKLDTAKSTLTITFKDGARAFLVGGSVYGGSDRYVQDQQSGAVYVLSKDIVAGLEIGESSLQLTDPRGFDITKIENVEIDWAGRKKAATRIQTDSENQKQVKTWGEADTKKPNQPLATFIDNINNMKPTEYKPDVKVDGVTPVFKVTYRDAKNASLGTLALYKIEKSGALPEGQELDPANPPKGETEYYVMTEKTRVPALVRKDPAQRSEQDLPIVFGDKAPPVDVPKGNPFQGVKPDIKPHGGGSMPPLPPPAGSGASPH